MMNIN
jgi:hypothetical protein